MTVQPPGRHERQQRGQITDMPNLMRGARALTALRGLLVVALLAAGAAQAVAADELIESRESLYNNIYVYKRGPLVTMLFGHNRRFYTESIYDTRDEMALPVTYTRYMTVALAYVPGATRLLEIGLGGGRTAWYLHKSLPEASMTAVELDKEVYELAVKHFGIREEPSFEVPIADGRNYLRRSDETWEVILIDAYRGPFVPFHLLTKQFFEEVKQHLAPGGVVAQNVEPSTMMFDAAVATIRAVFANVDLYQADGNIVALAYDGPRRRQEELLAAARQVTERYGLRYPLGPMVEERRIVTESPHPDVLTDDFAPVESLLAIERHNRKLDSFSQKP